MYVATTWLSVLCLLNVRITLSAVPVTSTYLTLTSSATWQDSESVPPQLSSLAVDTSSTTCSKTGNITANHWFVVDLGSIIDVMRVAITNDKVTCSGNFLNSYEIKIANLSAFNSKQPESNMKSCGTFLQSSKCPTLTQASIKGTKQCYGRFLMLSVNNSSGPLTVCYLKIKRRITSLSLIGNPSWQDSVSAKIPYSSSLAIDGKANQNVTLGQCAQTDVTTASQRWWVVDLKNTCKIYMVKIYSAKDSSNSLNNFDVQIANISSFNPSQPNQGMSLCHHYTATNASAVPIKINIYPQNPCSGRFLMITLKSVSLTLCEVKVKVL